MSVGINAGANIIKARSDITMGATGKGQKVENVVKAPKKNYPQWYLQ